MPKTCPNVPDITLNPKETWVDKKSYDNKALFLAKQFNDNFKTFKDYASEEILNAAPITSFD